MLHRSLLPSHQRWAGLLGSLRYVVVDECHHYRGVFGAHVAQVLRRLRRVCARYGAHPTFVLASATVADPEAAAGRLTGLEVAAGHRGRLPARPGDGRPVGAAVHVVRRRERRARPPRGVLGVRRPARRPGGRGCPHARLRPVAARRRADGAHRRGAARRGGARAAGAGRGLPRRLPPRGAARARGGVPRRPADRAGRHQRPRAGDRHQRSRRRPHRRVPRDPGRALAAARPGRSRGPGRARRARGPRRPARHLPRHPPRGALRAAGRGHRLRPHQPVRPRTAPVRRGPGDPADRGGPADVRPHRRPRRRLAHRGRACCAAARRGGTGPTGDAPATSPTSGPAAARPSSSSTSAPVASSATSTPAAPTAPPTRARSTCTWARPGWSSTLDLDEGVALDAPARGRLLHHRPRDHRHQHPRRAPLAGLGGLPPGPRHRRGDPPDRVLPQAPPALG